MWSFLYCLLWPSKKHGSSLFLFLSLACTHDKQYEKMFFLRSTDPLLILFPYVFYLSTKISPSFIATWHIRHLSSFPFVSHLFALVRTFSVYTSELLFSIYDKSKNTTEYNFLLADEITRMYPFAFAFLSFLPLFSLSLLLLSHSDHLSVSFLHYISESLSLSYFC